MSFYNSVQLIQDFELGQRPQYIFILWYTNKQVPYPQVHIYAIHTTYTVYLLVFQVCNTSGSLIPFCAACQSRKSNKYLMAFGNGFPLGTVKTALKRSSTNGCRILCITRTSKLKLSLENFLNKPWWRAIWAKILL